MSKEFESPLTTRQVRWGYRKEQTQRIYRYPNGFGVCLFGEMPECEDDAYAKWLLMTIRFSSPKNDDYYCVFLGAITPRGLVAGLTKNDVEEYLREVSELPPDTFAPRGPIA